jgi:hypothetical protein
MPKEGDKKMGVCDVHSLVKNDNGIRETTYCSTCNAWICPKCQPNYALRALAMAKKAKQKVFA